MLAFVKGSHRALVSSLTVKPFLISQTDLVKYIKRNLSVLKINFDIHAKICDIGCVSECKDVILKHESTWEAFERVGKYGYALPVINRINVIYKSQ